MARRKVEVLEGEICQLKSYFNEKTSNFLKHVASIHEKMDGRFAALKDMMKKMLRDKQNQVTLEAKEAIGGHGRGGNPNPLRERENPEFLEGDDGMLPLESLSREEMSMGYEIRGVDFVGRMDDFYRRCADFERRRGECDEGFKYDREREDCGNWGALPLRGMGG
ncbi:hypothetical protein KFK09_011554 [Dendrobium nobile]|uniref:Uncharacterized protein n=1 Tax=Dendrobium nobile TaxID=94219 RepID=A0A8T3BEW0_DENNO|nr:hypothetical protein KFK09_011554 [Dendrobium nobile]